MDAPKPAPRANGKVPKKTRGFHALPDGRWRLSYFCADHCRHIKTTGPLTKQDAQKAYFALKGGPCPQVAKAAAARDQAGRRSLGEVITDYLEWATRERPRSVRSRRSILGQWLPALGPDRPLRAITLPEIEKAMARQEDAGPWKPATRNRFRQGLAHLFNWAIARGYAESNPVQGIGRKQENNVKPYALTPDQEARLLAALSPGDRQVFTLAVHTGLRFGEIMAQRWADVDLEARTLKVTCPKDVKPDRKEPLEYVLPLNAVAARLLADLPRRGPLLFPTLTRGYITRFSALCRRLGLPRGVAFHKGSRDTFTSRLAQHAPLQTVMELSRHTDYKTARRYLAPNLEAQRAAVDALAAQAASASEVLAVETLLAQVAGK